ncbi:hypothetical protein MMC30_005313 [Trapelia coarctata]|nr:hypothetical protein [Trapelia coarctata]
METIQYVILDEPIAQKDLPLGSLVRDPQRPTNHCFSLVTSPPEELIWKRVDRHVEKALNFAGNPVEKRFRRHLFSRFQHDTNRILRLKASEAYVYGLSNLEAWLAELQMSTEAREFARSPATTKFVFVVTGFRTFRDGALSFERDQAERTVSVSISIPMTGIEAGYGQTFRSETDRRIYERKDETIFAVSYNRINVHSSAFRRSSDERIKSFIKKYLYRKRKQDREYLVWEPLRLGALGLRLDHGIEIPDLLDSPAVQGDIAARENLLPSSDPTITWIEERRDIEGSDDSATVPVFEVKEALLHEVKDDSDTDSDMLAWPEFETENGVNAERPESQDRRWLTTLFAIKPILLLAVLINLNGILFSVLVDVGVLSKQIATSTDVVLGPFILFISVLSIPEAASIFCLPAIELFFRRAICSLVKSNRGDVPPGYRRYEWICDCGRLLYADFDDSDPSAVDSLISELRKRPNVAEGSHSGASGGGIAVPTPSHSNSRNTVLRATIDRGSTPEDPQRGTHGPPADPRHLEPEPPTPRFLELCVDYHQGERRLGEVDLTNIITDSQLFAAIKKTYEDKRRRVATIHLLQPATVQFVKFYLEDQQSVHIDEAEGTNCWPPKEELDAKRWQWDKPKVSPKTFVNLMHTCISTRAVWFPRITHKLARSMTQETTPLPEGWGIRIVEGPNRALMAWILFLVTAAIFIASAVVAVVTKQYMSFGSFLFSILALAGSFMTSKYFEQKEQ